MGHADFRTTMKHIRLDRETRRVQHFIRSLPVEAGGAVLELRGKPLLRVLPVSDRPVDMRRLKEAILQRRNASRDLLADWQAVDREAW
jgi:hypothetical protein